MSASGGIGAAAGLGYQYLVTVMDVIDRMASHPGEDILLETEDHVSDIVDYSILSRDGSRILAVQAKSSVDGPSGSKFGIAEAATILLGMIEHDAQSYIIRTNRNLTKDCESFRAALDLLDPKITNSRQSIDLIGPFLDSDLLAKAIEAKLDFSRLSRCAVVCDPIDVDGLRDQIREKVQYLRRLRGVGTGLHTSEVLVGHLTAQILHLSSRRHGRIMNQTELDRLIGTPASVLASAAGEVDWGIPLGPVPSTMTVDRTESLMAIEGVLHGPPNYDAVRRIAVQGLSGIGKSTLAWMYLDSARHLYDRILWFDAQNTESVSNAVSEFLGIDGNKLSIRTLSERFKVAVSSAPATWLLIFDNAPDDRSLAPWVPVVGPIDVIATSTNSTGWSQWHSYQVPPMTESQSLALVRKRLDLDQLDGGDRRSASKLCKELDYWPLAIELACGFLSSSGRDLKMTDRYLNLLTEKIIDDETLVPSEYRSHSSLLQAIFVALDTIQSRDRQLPMRASALLETLAYLPARGAPLELVGRITAVAESNAGRYTISNDGVGKSYLEVKLDVESALRQLSTASLTYRGQDVETSNGEFSYANEIILDVVRQCHSDADRAKVLGLMHLALGDSIKKSLDNYNFRPVAIYIASALRIVEHSVYYKVLTREGIVMIGNLAAIFMHRGIPDAALKLYGRELEALDYVNFEAPVIRAKIYASRSALLLRTNAAIERIESTVDWTLFYLGRCLSDQEEHGAASEAATQVYETVQQVIASDTGVDAAVTDRWMSFLSDSYPNADQGAAVREMGNQLRSLNNDDAATLGAIEDHLEVESSPAVRLYLQYFRGDVLVSLGRFGESARAFSASVAESHAKGLGLGVGWTAILNAWRTAALQVVGAFDLEALDFCQQMDVLVGDQQPVVSDDTATAELCRVASRVLDRPLDETDEGLSRLDNLVVSPSHLTPHTEGVQSGIAACKRIASLRRSVAGAALRPVRAWARRQILVLGARQSVICLAIDGFEHLQLPSSGLTGRWICTEEGVGLLIQSRSPTFLWMPRFNTWWMDYEGAQVEPAAERLRGVVDSPEIAQQGSTILLVEYFGGSEMQAVDPCQSPVTVKVVT